MPCFGSTNGTMAGSTLRPTKTAPFPRPICATLQVIYNKMMDIVLGIMDFVLKMMDFVLEK